MTVMKVIKTSDNTSVLTKDTWSVLRITCMSLWWSFTWLWLIKSLGLLRHVLPYEHASVEGLRGLLSLSVCRRGQTRDQRVLPAAPSSTSPCVSCSPGSFQPAPRQPQHQGASVWGGWEVLRGLERTWNSDHSTSSYMSDCSQWSCYSLRLFVQPRFCLCALCRLSPQ